MGKLFKRSVLGVAVAAAALVSTGVQAKPATDTVDLYGQIAVSVWQLGEDKIGGGDAPIKVENESRFGLRGSHDLARGPILFWQMEGGNVADDGQGSGLGVRDTFVGLDFEDAGKIRLGRMLTPLYEIIDWPYSGQSAGKIFDGGGDIIGGARYDRQSNMIRYDSANYSGFSFNLAAGRGTESNKDSNFFGIGAHYSIAMFTFHAGYEGGQDRSVSDLDSLYSAWLKQEPGVTPTPSGIEGSTTSDTQAYLLGFEVNLEDFAFNAAYKHEQADYEDADFEYKGVTYEVRGLDLKQGSYSLGAIYNGVENWQFKLNYAANLDVKASGTELDNTADSIISAQAQYFLDDSALTYLRPYVIEKDGSDREFGWGAGIEYYF
ncbi:porin [Photobacterium jeanii]|uniref:Porin n=1 Tax=Photobacterium jeanii TaxID=858640 RepID=A0A178K988_9GAMM|nr:porin [Photobacterium jeanii]OAN13930.1 porin [Photobacterium jeanii]PST89915.1 porin [Photobacterium jeanii]